MEDWIRYIVIFFTIYILTTLLTMLLLLINAILLFNDIKIPVISKIIENSMFKGAYFYSFIILFILISMVFKVDGIFIIVFLIIFISLRTIDTLSLVFIAFDHIIAFILLLSKICFWFILTVLFMIFIFWLIIRYIVPVLIFIPIPFIPFFIPLPLRNLMLKIPPLPALTDAGILPLFDNLMNTIFTSDELKRKIENSFNYIGEYLYTSTKYLFPNLNSMIQETFDNIRADTNKIDKENDVDKQFNGKLENSILGNTMLITPDMTYIDKLNTSINNKMMNIRINVDSIPDYINTKK